jgi:hypothetical protein
VSLDRKDVRSKISDEAHAHLVALADFHEKDISELSSLYLEKAIMGEAHALKLYAARVARLGTSGKPDGERVATAGKSGKTTLRGV